MSILSEMTNQDQPKPKSVPPRIQAVLNTYAARRGLQPPDINEYLWPDIDLLRQRLPQTQAAVSLVLDAVEANQTILVFGDYDCDGITSTALLVRFFRDCFGIQPRWRLPNRQEDQYGLTTAKAAELLVLDPPDLLITLDCGTNSDEAIAIFHKAGVKTLVIDHHPSEGRRVDDGTIINPKLNVSASEELTELCTAGLVLFFCDALAKELHLEDRWDRDHAFCLAGLATLADACRLTRTNRALVKLALSSLNRRAFLREHPGLAALMAEAGLHRTNQRDAQFQLIPRLNALGRLASAEPGVELLLTDDTAEAKRIASLASAMNRARQDLQERTVSSAIAQARHLLGMPSRSGLLLLADPHWHHGVVGPAASRVAEQFGCSAVLLGLDSAGMWRGSGRARRGEDLGQLVRQLKLAGRISSGGGHSAAVGLTLTDRQLRELQKSADLAVPASGSLELESESTGDVDALTLEEWAFVMDLLEPFGPGNPWPLVRATHCCLSGNVVPVRTRTGEVWAVKANFQTRSGGHINVLHKGSESPWRQRTFYDLELDLSSSSRNGATFRNWICRTSRQSKSSVGRNGREPLDSAQLSRL
jgi:single-stranded-DNA-specific exonuclease